jgi:hypothetical protein
MQTVIVVFMVKFMLALFIRFKNYLASIAHELTMTLIFTVLVFAKTLL